MRGFKISRTVDGDNIKRDLLINQFALDEEVVRNNIEAVCQVIRGELRYNIDLGIPVSSKNSEKDLSISKAILNITGVRRIKSFESKQDSRKYSAKIIVETIYGKDLEVNL